jgi:hypothetical protein
MCASSSDSASRIPARFGKIRKAVKTHAAGAKRLPMSGPEYARTPAAYRAKPLRGMTCVRTESITAATKQKTIA